MKYEVGDKVRIVDNIDDSHPDWNDIIFCSEMRDMQGKKVTITSAWTTRNVPRYRIDEYPNNYAYAENSFESLKPPTKEEEFETLFKLCD